jgi:hypothetical protein
MKNSNKEDIKYQIDQLRKDKIIYAVESVAISISSLLLYVGTQFLSESFPVLSNYRESITLSSVIFL